MHSNLRMGEYIISNISGLRRAFELGFLQKSKTKPGPDIGFWVGPPMLSSTNNQKCISRLMKIMCPDKSNLYAKVVIALNA
jgi:hypothetical protein